MNATTDIGRPGACAAANASRCLSLVLPLLAAVAAWPAPGAAGAASPGAPPILCGTPVPIAEAPSAPPARLDCAQGADGETRLRLTVPGRAPLVLDAADGDARPGGSLRPEPWSFSLRRLAGPPPLYWLRWLERGTVADGAEVGARWRDLVWRADVDAPPPILATWTLPDDRLSRVDLHADQAETLTLDDRPPILWVTRRRVERTSWDLPGMAPYRCAEDCATVADSEDRAAGAPACRRDCEREHGLTVNRVTTLESRIHPIEVTTGLRSAETTAWARFYEPLPRPGSDHLGRQALLILDDGAAGWLLVPVQAPDLNPAGGLDPAAPRPIPALASCWLYNHRPRQPGDSARPYPPAAAEQMRADHRAPAACCTLESSPDGRRILVFGTPSEPGPPAESANPPGPPRQFLALYDLTTRQCWSANLAVDGPLGRAPYDRLGDPVFSPDGRHLGYRAQRGDARFVVIDDREGPAFHRVGAPVFSVDGRHSAYWAREDGREFIVFDGTPGPAWAGAGAPVFSPAGGPPAYRVQDARGWRVVVDGTPGPPFDDIGWFNADASGGTTLIADLVFSARGELAYAARVGDDWFMVRGRRGPAYDQVGPPVFSPDGTRLAFRARRRERDFIVLDGQAGPAYDQVGTPVFSPDGRGLAFWAAADGAEFVVWGGHAGPKFAPPGSVGPPVFAQTAETPLYLAAATPDPASEDSPRPLRLWSGDRPLADLEVGAGAVLNRITGNPSWRASQGAVTDKVPPGWRILGGGAGDPLERALVFSPDGQVPAYATHRHGRARVHIGETDDGPFDAVADPVFSPTGERLAYRARLGGLWFAILTPPTGAPGPARAPATVPLTARAPRLLPHPVALNRTIDEVINQVIVGGSARGRWYGSAEWIAAVEPPAADDRCAPVGPDWVQPTLRWRLYGARGPLGTCSGRSVARCRAEAAGPDWLRLTLRDCDLKGSVLAVAGDWNALPRRARMIRETDRFAPLVRAVLAGHALPELPIHAIRVQAIDLEGDGREEYLIKSTGGTDGRAGGDDIQFSMLLLARSDRDPAPAALCDWHGSPDAAEDCTVSNVADLDGDGTLEVIVDVTFYEGWGADVYRLEHGHPVKTPLGWSDGT